MLDKHDDRLRTCLILLLQVALYLFVHYQSTPYFVLVGVSLYLLSSAERRKYLRIIFRDVSGIYAILRIAASLKSTSTIPKRFREVCAQNPEKLMIRFKDETWTFQQVEEYSNKVANYFAGQGIGDGDNVAIFMETCAEYVPIWLGILKLGASASLINHNLKDKPLIHCIKAVPSAAIITGEDLEKSIEEIEESLEGMPKYCHKNNNSTRINYLGKFIDLRTGLKNSQTSPRLSNKMISSSKAFHVFTSGTTGMPKAAVFTHDRYNVMATGINKYVGLKKEDILYISLPLYHANGIVLGLGQAVLWGSSVALRHRFSSTQFWTDCIRYNCTVFIYIGEICRYLLTSPPKAEDRQHKIRLMLGNGLKQHIWKDFLERFNIPDICEFYGSSEGIGSLLNNEGRVGAVGYQYWLFSPFKLVKFDVETEQPIRNATGRCIKISNPGEAGMHIARIRNFPGQRFEGYADGTATRKKIIHNVFEEGDQYYVSGDTFTFDDDGYLYFHDRTGDTFRWKGENVATTEVEQVISEITLLKDTAVYGVQVPGMEGKAGMAAIVDSKNLLSLEILYDGLKKRLPKYARPLFIRVTNELPLTDTYKIKKKQFKEEGFNVNHILDKIYFFNQSLEKYVLCDKDCYDGIMRGQFEI